MGCRSDISGDEIAPLISSHVDRECGIGVDFGLFPGGVTGFWVLHIWSECYLDLPLFVVDACQVAVDDGVVGTEVEGAQVRRHSSVRRNMQTSVTSG